MQLATLALRCRTEALVEEKVGSRQWRTGKTLLTRLTRAFSKNRLLLIRYLENIFLALAPLLARASRACCISFRKPFQPFSKTLSLHAIMTQTEFSCMKIPIRFWNEILSLFGMEMLWVRKGMRFYKIAVSVIISSANSRKKIIFSVDFRMYF